MGALPRSGRGPVAAETPERTCEAKGRQAAPREAGSQILARSPQQSYRTGPSLLRHRDVLTSWRGSRAQAQSSQNSLLPDDPRPAAPGCPRGIGSSAEVLVRTPAATDLARLLIEAGAVALPQADGGLVIRQMPARQISDLAAAHGVPIYELTPRHGSLEDAYLQLADSSTEYRADTTSSPQKDAEA